MTKNLKKSIKKVFIKKTAVHQPKLLTRTYDSFINLEEEENFQQVRLVQLNMKIEDKKRAI